MLANDRRRPRCTTCKVKHKKCDRGGVAGGPCSLCVKLKIECVRGSRQTNWSNHAIISEAEFQRRAAHPRNHSIVAASGLGAAHLPVLNNGMASNGHNSNTPTSAAAADPNNATVYSLPDHHLHPSIQNGLQAAAAATTGPRLGSFLPSATASGPRPNVLPELIPSTLAPPQAQPQQNFLRLPSHFSSLSSGNHINLHARYLESPAAAAVQGFEGFEQSPNHIAYRGAPTRLSQQPTISRSPYELPAFGVGHLTSQPNPSTYTGPSADMSLSFENRGFMQEPASYPQMQMHEDHEDYKHEQTRYPSPTAPTMSDNPYQPHPHAHAPTMDSTEGDVRAAMGMPELPLRELSDAPSPGRSKPIIKPDRGNPPKDANGRFVCNWLGCTEEVKDFGRKCEWGKHMDKHDRPYKCPAEGCEKLPGFTYSGGLLRHEREVHNKHGGPRKQLNCPHPNCKRHTGKGFSRQENLNEHLRRVHTDGSVAPVIEESEEDGNEVKIGQKRKRGVNTDPDILEEMRRLKQENEELRRATDMQNAQTAELVRQVHQLQRRMGPHMQAPEAQMM